MMDVGQLTERVTLLNPQADVPQTDWGASDAGVYETVETRWADVEEDAGSLDRRAGRDEPEQRATFTVRSWDEVRRGESRLRWDGREWIVTGVKKIGRRRRHMQVETVLDPNG